MILFTKGKTTANFELSNHEDGINRTYLDTKLLKIEGHMSPIEKDYSEVKLHSNKKQSVEILIDRAVKSTIQTLHDRGLFDKNYKAVEVQKDCPLIRRRKPTLTKIS